MTVDEDLLLLDEVGHLSFTAWVTETLYLRSEVARLASERDAYKDATLEALTQIRTLGDRIKETHEKLALPTELQSNLDRLREDNEST